MHYSCATDFTRISDRKKARIPCDRGKKRDVENDFSKRFTGVPTQTIFQHFSKKVVVFCCKTCIKNGVIFFEKKVSKRYTCIPKREVKIRP